MKPESTSPANRRRRDLSRRDAGLPDPDQRRRGKRQRSGPPQTGGKPGATKSKAPATVRGRYKGKIGECKGQRYRGQDQAGKMNSPLQMATDQGSKDLTSAEGRRRPRIWASVGAMARMSMKPRARAAGMPGPRIKKEAFISGWSGQ
jgi:hypothetical protein